MARTLFSFIGTGNYKPAYYTWKNKEAHSPFMPVVLDQFFAPDRIVLFMTKEAKEKQADKLAETHLKYEIVEIPTGGSEDELWVLFDQVSAAFKAKEEVIIDVTHGFRFQPLLGVTAAIYLQTVKNIQIERIVYGAFDPNSHSADHRAPIFDLTPLLDIIEWSQGSRRFHERGDAGTLKDLLQKLTKRAYVEDTHPKPKHLSSFANKWEDWTQALSLNRIPKIPDFSASLAHSTQKVQEDLTHVKGTSPLIPILENIKEDLKPFTRISDSFEDSIRQQWHIVQWYLHHEQYTNALTLANELIISVGVVSLLKKDPMSLEHRKTVNRLYGSVNQAKQDTALASLISYDEQLVELADLYHLVSEIRNDINHCGFRDAHIEKPKKMKQQIEQRLEKVQRQLIAPLLDG